MIDLSNNNGSVDFQAVKHSHGRVYLKRSEGANFTDGKFVEFHAAARNAGLRPGAYHFARPSQFSPQEEAHLFLRLAPPLKRGGANLRHCLDFEDERVAPSPVIGRWAEEWLTIVRNHTGFYPIIYGNAYYLEGCQFRRVPGALWLASYGRNDGREYPFLVPHPWTYQGVAAHQFSSVARVQGVAGACDISRVIHPRELQIGRLQRR